MPPSDTPVSTKSHIPLEAAYLSVQFGVTGEVNISGRPLADETQQRVAHICRGVFG
jgi:hypothetical protein